MPPGSISIQATRPGFVAKDSAAFEVRAGEAARVLVDIQLTFVLPEIEVRAETPSPTDSVQPVSMSDMLAGSVFEVAPLEGDDFQSLLLLLPGVVRGPDGRLRIKGGQPSQGALQISSASLNDPSTGDFDLELRRRAWNPSKCWPIRSRPNTDAFRPASRRSAPGRERTSGRSRPAISFPRFRRAFAGIRGSSRASRRGVRSSATGRSSRRIFSSAMSTTPVKSLPDEPEIELRSFDSFTRVDTVDLGAPHDRRRA